MATQFRVVTKKEAKVERFPWGPHVWLSRPDIVDAKALVVRVNMAKGKGGRFHMHPTLEEMIYVLEGRAEQWIDREVRRLGPGDLVVIPKKTVHATFNAVAGVLRYLSILNPTNFRGTPEVDMEDREPWKSISEKRERSRRGR